MAIETESTAGDWRTAGGAAAHAPPRSPAPAAGTGLGTLLRPIRGRLAIALLLQVAASAAAIVPFIAVVELARILFAPGPVDPGQVWRVAGIAVVALAARFALFGAAGLITHFADNTLTLLLRRSIAARLGRVPLGWFDDRGSGRVKQVVQDDVTAMHHVVAHALLDIASAVVTPLLITGYLLWADWRLALVTLAPLPLYALTMALLMRGFGDQMARHSEAMARINAAVVEFVEGIAVLKVFGRSGQAHRAFQKAADDFRAFFLSWMRPMARTSALAYIAVAPPTVLLLVLAAGTGFTALGWTEPVDVVPFVLLGLGLAGPLLALEQTTTRLRTAKAAAERVGEVLAAEELPPVVHPEAPADEHVRFSGVAFGYDGRTEVLSGIDLELRPGTVTALVGPSGAGKSTLAQLLPRFRDPTAGAVTLGGVDLRHIEPAELYRHVGFVFQETRLLRTTVAENIALGRPGAGAADVERAARAARIHDRIARLPRGYDSVAGEDARFSGGEAQRIGIARALLADPPVLVLDEATAFADPESEAEIQEALSRLVEGRTLLVIAHRLATIAGADQIAVLDGGRIVERGTHAELIAAGGRYAAMWAAHGGGGGPGGTAPEPARNDTDGASGGAGAPGKEAP